MCYNNISKALKMSFNVCYKNISSIKGEPMNLNKREKILILCSLVIIVLSFYSFEKRGSILKRIDDNKLFFKSYQETKLKQYEKDIDKKLSSNTLKKIVLKLPINKLEILSVTLKNQDLLKILNTKDKGKVNSAKYFESELSYSEAISLYNASIGFQELASLSQKLGEYLKNHYPNFNYMEVIKNEGKIPNLIKAREKYLKLTENSEMKNIIKNLTSEQLALLNSLVENDANMINLLNCDKDFINNLKVNSYNILATSIPEAQLESFVSISKKIDKLEEISPEFKEFIAKNIGNIDFNKNYQYGEFYLADINNQKELEKEYKEQNYNFDNPMIKVNPFKRTPLVALVKVENELAGKNVTVTVNGENGSSDYTYTTVVGKDGEFPIVGLYPRTENKIRYTIDNKSKNIEIKTEKLDDILPAVVIEKRVDGSIEPGMNLVSFNTKEKALPFVFDKNGNIRYLLDVSSVLQKAHTIKENNEWYVGNDETIFTFDILGRVLSTKDAEYYSEQENWKNGVLFRNAQYLPKTNNQLIVYGFSDKVYPSGVLSELGIDSKQELFKARLYFDKYNFEENNILSGRRIELF